MKIDTRNIIIICLLVIIVLLGLTIFQEYGEAQEIGKSEDNIKHLKEINNRLQEENSLLDVEIEKLRIISDSLRQLTENERKEITVLKQQENERIETINNYNTNELFVFFTEFYNYERANNQLKANSTKNK